MKPDCRSKFLAGCLALLLPLIAAADDPLWIDVRSSSEYSEKHVEQAINIPYTEIAEGIAKLGTTEGITPTVFTSSSVQPRK